MSNGLDPDQDSCFIGPDLCPNCLLRLSADIRKSPLARKVNEYGYFISVVI